MPTFVKESNTKEDAFVSNKPPPLSPPLRHFHEDDDNNNDLDVEYRDTDAAAVRDKTPSLPPLPANSKPPAPGKLSYSFITYQ